MIITLPLLNTPNAKTINDYMYDKDSYIAACQKFIANYKDAGGALLYRYDPFISDVCLTMCYIYNPENIIGKVIDLNCSDYSATASIDKWYYDIIGDDISTYYIMLRILGTVKMVDGNKIAVIKKILGMELHNDVKNKIGGHINVK